MGTRVCAVDCTGCVPESELSGYAPINHAVSMYLPLTELDGYAPTISGNRYLQLSTLNDPLDLFCVVLRMRDKAIRTCCQCLNVLIINDVFVRRLYRNLQSK